MTTTHKVSSEVDVVASSAQIPGLGFVPVNAFVLHAAEPVLVDTGLTLESADFMTALRSVIDPAELKWIWLTHPDADHTGSLHELLELNPDLKVITTFLGVGIIGLSNPLPLDRVHLLNPGQSLSVGDRTLTAVKPPAFDNPSTTGLFDDKSRSLFSSDCFGALLQQVPERAEDLSKEELRQGQVMWATVDAPWLHRVDRGVFSQDLRTIRALDPDMVLSSHLPAASGAMFDQLIESLAMAPDADPFIGPDQVALEAMLAQMTGAAG
jgi:flavorubredoxin